MRRAVIIIIIIIILLKVKIAIKYKRHIIMCRSVRMKGPQYSFICIGHLAQMNLLNEATINIPQ